MVPRSIKNIICNDAIDVMVLRQKNAIVPSMVLPDGTTVNKPKNQAYSKSLRHYSRNEKF